MSIAAEVIEARRHQSFDVICAGEPLWQASPHQRGNAAPAVSAGLLNIATMLAVTRVRVGLATALEDDRFGRRSRAEMAALGVDVSAVKLASVVTDLVIVDASGGQSWVTSAGGEVTDLEIPPSWSSQVLLLSGVSAITSRLAALCKAARRARRHGTVVVLDVVGSLRHWADHDPRVISMVLREADVVRCSVFDLAVIGLDSATVRRAMRSNATLVVNDAAGTVAVGTFGAVEVRACPESIAPQRYAESCAAAICAEFARPQAVAETQSGRWYRVLREEAPRLATSLLSL
jgi:sugar/nucleoside kinase (ribokinase family)